MHHRAGWPWWVLLLLGLGGGLGLPGVGFGQEGLPTGGGRTAVLEEARRLSAESTQLYGAGQYAAALPLAQRALVLREQALGPTHPEVAETLSILGLLYLAQGQYAQAEPLLHRALAMAGAESQVMTLWSVEDDATRALMVAYYRRLQAGEGRAEALRQVQLTMLASPQQAHPFYWAAFVLSGAWSPLTHR